MSPEGAGSAGRFRSLADWVGAAVSRFPSHVALEADAGPVTYLGLWRASGKAAAEVLAAARPGCRVAVWGARSWHAHVSYLGALRAGASVVPLSPANPVIRNLAILRESGAELVLTDPSMPAEQLTAIGAAGVAAVDGLAGGRPGLADDVRPVAHPGDEAYVLFTSGSTGVPKGVPIRHRHVLAYLAHVLPRYDIGPGSRLSHTFDLTFDPSVFDLFATWGSGGTLVMCAADDLMFPAEYVRRERITHWYSVPSLVSVAGQLGTLRPASMPGLRWSMFIGERLTRPQASSWRAAAPASVIDNVYGPTELCVSCAEYRLPADVGSWPSTSNDSIPIGTVAPHLEHLLLDETGARADEGELCVRGSQRFDGYVNPEHNIGRFLSVDGTGTSVYRGEGPVTPRHWYRTGDRLRTEHGQLVHLGRLDDQVKVRGYRIEPAEIEAVLRKHPMVHEAVVVGCGDHDLVAFFTGSPAASSGLAGLAGRHLPGYMLPDRYEHLDALPVTGNRKIDRGALAARAAAGHRAAVARAR